MIDEWSATANHWKCTLVRKAHDGKRRRMTVYFSQGSGFNGREPEVGAVLESLALDAFSFDNAQDFEDFAANFGYDPDSRKAEKIYLACGREARKLARFLGDHDYQALLYDVEQL